MNRLALILALSLTSFPAHADIFQATIEKFSSTPTQIGSVKSLLSADGEGLWRGGKNANIWMTFKDATPMKGLRLSVCPEHKIQSDINVTAWLSKAKKNPVSLKFKGSDKAHLLEFSFETVYDVKELSINLGSNEAPCLKKISLFTGNAKAPVFHVLLADAAGVSSSNPPAAIPSDVIFDPEKHFREHFDIGPSATIFRIQADFNNDGFGDEAFGNSEMFGNSGGPWTLYIRTSNNATVNPKYTLPKGEIAFHPLAFKLRPASQGVGQILTYNRQDTSKGFIEVWTVTTETIKQDNKTRRPINPTGADKKEYESLFGELRSKPLHNTCSSKDFILGTCKW